MYSCYSRVNFYLCLSWRFSLFRVESQSCSQWLQPEEGERRANKHNTLWKNKKNKKTILRNRRCSRVSPGGQKDPDAIIVIERYLSDSHDPLTPPPPPPPPLSIHFVIPEVPLEWSDQSEATTCDPYRLPYHHDLFLKWPVRKELDNSFLNTWKSEVVTLRSCLD